MASSWTEPIHEYAVFDSEKLLTDCTFPLDQFHIVLGQGKHSGSQEVKIQCNEKLDKENHAQKDDTCLSLSWSEVPFSACPPWPVTHTCFLCRPTKCFRVSSCMIEEPIMRWWRQRRSTLMHCFRNIMESCNCKRKGQPQRTHSNIEDC